MQVRPSADLDERAGNDFEGGDCLSARKPFGEYVEYGFMRNTRLEEAGQPEIDPAMLLACHAIERGERIRPMEVFRMSSICDQRIEVLPTNTEPSTLVRRFPRT